MASEIGHIVYAARVSTNLGKAVQRPVYWTGTLFPNIYQLGSATRHFTHPNNVSLYSLIGNDDFTTGLRVHTWIDATRNQFFCDQNIKERVPWHPCIFTALALLEDQLLYEHFDDWNLIHRVLSSIDNHELALQTDRAQINKWHGAIQEYIATKPTDKSRLDFLIRKGVTKKIAQEINELVAKLANNKKAIDVLYSFWRHLEDVLQ